MDGKCTMKSAIGNMVPSTTVSSFVAQDGRPKAKRQSSVTCPGNDGQDVTVDGVVYTIRCNKDYPGNDLSTPSSKASFSDCINACNAYSGCVDVSFVTGTCYLKSAVGTIQSTANVWTAEKKNKPSNNALSITCPGSQPVTYSPSNANTKQFTVSCSTDYAGGDLAQTNTPTMQGCVEACGARSDCTAVSYRGQGCYLKGGTRTASTDSNVIGAILKSGSTSSTSGSGCGSGVFQCRANNPITCGGGGAQCNNYCSPSRNGGFCSSVAQCNTQCSKDADCGNGKICLTNSCCPNSNGSVCANAVDAVCTNTGTAKYMFAKLKRATVWNEVLGRHVEVTPGY